MGSWWMRTPSSIISSQDESASASGFDSEIDIDSGHHHELDELLSKKGKNSKATDAQKYLVYCVREAAKYAGIWESAPKLEEITPLQLDKFNAKAYSLCPALKQVPKDLHKRLGDSLSNRRSTIRKNKKKSPVKRSQPRNLFRAPAGHHTQQPSPATSIYSPGITVNIFHEERVIGSAVYLTEENWMFSRLLFVSKNTDVDTDISLSEASSSGKLMFVQLEKLDVFLWRSSRLLLPGSELPKTSPLAPEQESDEEKGSGSSESEEDVMSEYEKLNLNKRKENKRMLDQLMEDVLPSVSSTKKPAKSQPSSSRAKAKGRKKVPSKAHQPQKKTARNRLKTTTATSSVPAALETVKPKRRNTKNKGANTSKNTQGAKKFNQRESPEVAFKQLAHNW